jgi:hypothetical protein
MIRVARPRPALPRHSGRSGLAAPRPNPRTDSRRPNVAVFDSRPRVTARANSCSAKSAVTRGDRPRTAWSRHSGRCGLQAPRPNPRTDSRRVAVFGRTRGAVAVPRADSCGAKSAMTRDARPRPAWSVCSGRHAFATRSTIGRRPPEKLVCGAEKSCDTVGGLALDQRECRSVRRKVGRQKKKFSQPSEFRRATDRPRECFDNGSRTTQKFPRRRDRREKFPRRSCVCVCVYA